MTVDRSKQRARISQVAADVIAREGIDAATIRHIAAEIGCSTSVITYYFQDKQELLIAAYRSLRDEMEIKIDAVLDRDNADLVGCLLCMTAVDVVSFKRWRSYVAFWDRAARDQTWAAMEYEDLELALARIDGVIQARNGNHVVMADASRTLNAFIQGISVQILMNPALWPRNKVVSSIEFLVEELLGPRQTAYPMLSLNHA